MEIENFWRKIATWVNQRKCVKNSRQVISLSIEWLMSGLPAQKIQIQWDFPSQVRILFMTPYTIMGFMERRNDNGAGLY